MVKKKDSETTPTVDNVQVVAPAAVPPTAPPAPPTQESLLQEDKQVLEIAKLQKKLAEKEAQKALAENNSADLQYRYLILQLYMKYGMTALDALDEQGNIHRNYQLKQQG